MKKNWNFFLYQEGFTNTQNIIWHNPNYVRKNDVFSYNIVISEANINIYRQQVNINVYVRCFAIFAVQENTWIIFVTLTYLCNDLYFLYELFFIPLPLILLPYDGFSNRDTIIGHVNMCLVKTNWENKMACSIPCCRERDLYVVI